MHRLGGCRSSQRRRCHEQQLRVAVVITRFIESRAAEHSPWIRSVRHHGHVCRRSPLVGAGREAGLSWSSPPHESRDPTPRRSLGPNEIRGRARSATSTRHTHSTKAGALGRMAAHRVGFQPWSYLPRIPLHDFQSAPRAVCTSRRSAAGSYHRPVRRGRSGSCRPGRLLKIARPDRICTMPALSTLHRPRDAGGPEGERGGCRTV